jgi:hypothetical protein
MILSDMAEGRIGLMVAVTLPTERAYFTVQPTLINQTAEAVPVQLWLNGVLALGADSMSRQTRFVIPTEQVTVHSRGPEGWTVPDAHSVMPWPLVGETDLQIYESWQSYLGLFIPNLDAPFMGAYNPDTDLGVARLITPGAVVGNKLFAFGLAFPDRSYTDDNSQYFEIWGGVNEGFWTEDDIVVEPAGQVSWQEAWWPLAGLGGLTWANQDVAIYLSPAMEMDQTLTAHFAQPLAGQVIMIAGGQTLLKESFTATPSQPLTWTFDSPTEPIEITLLDQAGEPRLIYKASP